MSRVMIRKLIALSCCTDLTGRAPKYVARTGEVVQRQFVIDPSALLQIYAVNVTLLSSQVRCLTSLLHQTPCACSDSLSSAPAGSGRRLVH